MNNKLSKKLIATGAIVGLTAMGVATNNTAHASEWQANSVDKIMQQLQEQKGTDEKLAVYIVQEGDTLSGIAEATDLTLDQILAMNDIPNPDLIYVGDKINLGLSNQARKFVEKQGQNLQENQKDYEIPESNEAKQEIAKTDDSLKSSDNKYSNVSNTTPSLNQNQNETSDFGGNSTVNNQGNQGGQDQGNQGGQDQGNQGGQDQGNQGNQNPNLKPATETIDGWQGKNGQWR